MLTFKSTQRLFFILFLLLFLADFFLDIKPWMYLIAGVLFFLLIAWGSYHIQTNFFVKGIHKGETTDKVVALTFDDGPTPQITNEVLGILREYKAPATFFLIGKKVEDNKSLVREIIADGHLIGNHSFSHDNKIGFFGANRITKELTTTNIIVNQTTGNVMEWYRPPFGVTNPTIANVTAELGMTVIGWSIRTYDTMRKDPQAILEAVKKGLCPGAIILMHDRFEYTGQALRLILAYLSEEGYTVVGLDQLTGQGAYS